MSWYVTIPPTLAERFATVVEGLELTDVSAEAPAALEMREQLRVAKRAVLTLFFSGALGDSTQGVWAGSLGGHANVDHLPRAGWSGETVNLSLSQTDYPPALREAYAAAGMSMPSEGATPVGVTA